MWVSLRWILGTDETVSTVGGDEAGFESILTSSIKNGILYLEDQVDKVGTILD